LLVLLGLIVVRLVNSWPGELEPEYVGLGLHDRPTEDEDGDEGDAEGAALEGELIRPAELAGLEYDGPAEGVGDEIEDDPADGRGDRAGDAVGDGANDGV